MKDNKKFKMEDIKKSKWKMTKKIQMKKKKSKWNVISNKKD